jgi:predicted nucleic acid-binding protein
MNNVNRQELFVDTSAIIALFAENDPHHKKAKQFVEELAEDIILSTVRTVYFESMTVVSQKYGLFEARKFREFFSLIPFRFYDISDAQVSKAEHLLFAQSSKNLPFFDCVYAAVMQSNSIRKVFTYDRDFKKLGVLPVG